MDTCDTRANGPLGRVALAGAALLALACDAEPGPSFPPPAEETCATDLTWSGFAGPLVTEWCQPCHSADVPEEDRQGAPLDLNLDTPAQVLALAGPVLALATGEAPTMPPGGGPTDEERAQLVEWLTCGSATGTVDPPAIDPCAPRVEVVGDARSSTWDCAAGNVVVGDLVADAPSDCICEVTGSIVAEGSVELPELLAVGGDVEVRGGADVVDAPWLATVGGSVWIEGNATLTAVELPRVVTIGGALTVADNPAIETLHALTSLESVGDLVIRGNTALRSADGLPRVASLASLEVAENPALTSMLSLLFVTEVPGEVVFRDNDALDRIDVLPEVTRVGGVRILDHDVLEAIGTFAFLSEVDGTVELSGNAALKEVGYGTDGGGPLEALAAVGVDLVLARNGGLVSIGALDGVDAVGGDVVVIDNPKLSKAEVQALVDAIDSVGGTVQVSGNKP